MRKSKEINIGIVGATGKVGQAFLFLLSERGFPFNEVRLFASQTSEGKKHRFKKKSYFLNSPHKGSFKGLDLVFFASSSEVSKKWAYEALKEGAYVIDNSSYFRMNPSYPLVVPEVNGKLISGLKEPQIIASPNCSTIQLVLVLNPLFQSFGLDQVHVASYQAVSGAGRKAQKELLEQMHEFKRLYKKANRFHSESALISHFENKLEEKKESRPSYFPKPLAFNCIPQIGSFNEEGYCVEEEKIMSETKKILNCLHLKISAFTVRIPSWNAHAEALWVKFSNRAQEQEVLDCLLRAPSLKVFSSKIMQSENEKMEMNFENGMNSQGKENQTALNYGNGMKSEVSDYPYPLERSGKDFVGVGRIHRDLSDDRTWIFWVVGDNLRKGAALNAIQIAEVLFSASKKVDYEKKESSKLGFSKDQINPRL